MKRARHNHYRVKKPGEPASIRHTRPATISRVFHDAMVSSHWRLSASTRSRKASTPSLPCSLAISAIDLPSSYFSAGFLTA